MRLAWHRTRNKLHNPSIVFFFLHMVCRYAPGEHDYIRMLCNQLNTESYWYMYVMLWYWLMLSLWESSRHLHAIPEIHPKTHFFQENDNSVGFILIHDFFIEIIVLAMISPYSRCNDLERYMTLGGLIDLQDIKVHYFAAMVVFLAF